MIKSFLKPNINTILTQSLEVKEFTHLYNLINSRSPTTKHVEEFRNNRISQIKFPENFSIL